MSEQQTNGLDHPEQQKRESATVRTADPRDFSEVCRLLLLAHAEAGMFPASNMKVAWHVDRFLRGPWGLLPAATTDGSGNVVVDNGPRGVIGVIGQAGGPPRTLEGLVMLGLGSYWYTDSAHIEEYILYVDPGHRSFAHARRLIEWQKHQAGINKVPLITGVLSNDDTARKCALHARMLTKVGEYFTWLPEGHSFEADKLTGPGRLKELSDGRRR
jgi:hypothetical protein